MDDFCEDCRRPIHVWPYSIEKHDFTLTPKRKLCIPCLVHSTFGWVKAYSDRRRGVNQNANQHSDRR